MTGWRKSATCLLAVWLLISLCTAAWAAFPDTEGHWAREDIVRAQRDGYLTGGPDGRFRPDEPLLASHLLTILARALALPDAPEAETAAAPTAWYLESARRAVAAGLIAPDFAAFEDPVSRQSALLMTARGYGINPAGADLHLLSGFSDAAALADGDRLMLAALVERDLVHGWEGQLHLEEHLTRAQFMTLLYRMEGFYETAWRAAREAEREVERTTQAAQAQDGEALRALVTSEYAGDYTLAWAEEHDYLPEEKEAWVNLQGYASDTQYLIWVNLTYQRANIFEGSEGNWRLVRHSIVGTGRPGSDTPRGTWKITYHNATGWTTATYTVRPVVGFKGGGYAFHSWLYSPGTWAVSDLSMGFPVSAGCVRMYPEDINWVFENIGVGTTVVVY